MDHCPLLWETSRAATYFDSDCSYPQIPKAVDARSLAVSSVASRLLGYLLYL